MDQTSGDPLRLFGHLPLMSPPPLQDGGLRDTGDRPLSPRLQPLSHRPATFSRSLPTLLRLARGPRTGLWWTPLSVGLGTGDVTFTNRLVPP